MRQLEIKKASGVAVIKVIGELEFTNAEEFEKEIRSLIKENMPKIVVNFSEANYIDSAGLGVLIAGWKLSRQAQGDLRLCGLDENLKDVLNMTRLLGFFKVFNTEEEAIKSFE